MANDQMLEIGETCEPARARRSGGRAARVALRAAPLSEDMRPVRPGMAGGQYRPISDAGVQKIHQSALEALEVVVWKMRVKKCGSRLLQATSSLILAL